MQMQQLPQEIQQMPQGAEPRGVPDMAVEDAGGSTMEMMGGLAGGL